MESEAKDTVIRAQCAIEVVIRPRTNTVNPPASTPARDHREIARLPASSDRRRPSRWDHGHENLATRTQSSAAYIGNIKMPLSGIVTLGHVSCPCFGDYHDYWSLLKTLSLSGNMGNVDCHLCNKQGSSPPSPSPCCWRRHMQGLHKACRVCGGFPANSKLHVGHRYLTCTCCTRQSMILISL